MPNFVLVFTDKKLELYGKEIILLTGIAQPQHLHKHLEKYVSLITALKYPDHHNFTSHDIKELEEDFEKLNANNRAIITTEKDAVKLLNRDKIPAELRARLYYIPISITFIGSSPADFLLKLENDVRTN